MSFMGVRHAARELALQMLFQVDIGRVPVEEVLAEEFEEDEEMAVPSAPSIVYAHKLVHGTAQHLERIDRILATFAEEWAFDRLANVDRNVLRLAIYEMLYMEEVPDEVAINEAVELAKRFSTEESGKFVNGILGSLVRKQASGELEILEAPETEDESDLESEEGVDETGTPRIKRRRQSLRLGSTVENYDVDEGD